MLFTTVRNLHMSNVVARLLKLRGRLGGRRGYLTLEFIFGFGKLPHCLTHSASKFGQLLRAEQEQHNAKDDHEIRPGEIEERSDVHKQWVVD